jgi:hypothetical protein
MKPPATLYHYTSLGIFQKIVGTKRIRASHYTNFGDKDELRLGARMLLDAVKQHRIDSRDTGYRDFLVEGIEDFLDGQLAVHVLSFTETSDSAYHWQEYASSGVAIGFCGKRLSKGFPIDIARRMPGVAITNPVRPNPANRLMQCRYVGKFDFAELVSNRFFGANSYPTGFRNEHVRSHVAIYACLSVSIYQTICTIKGSSFEDEAEWRCVHINPDAQEYPVKSENGKEFIEMEFEPGEFIKEVQVGPHGQSRACEDAIERMRLNGTLRCSPTSSNLRQRDGAG